MEQKNNNEQMPIDTTSAAIAANPMLVAGVGKVVKFNTKEVKGLFVKVPDTYKNFVIKQYSVAGTWIMETDSKELNHWKIQIPKGQYGIIGFSNSLKESEVDVHLKMSMLEYFKLLSEKDITVNYSKFTGQWLVLLEV